MDVVTLIDSILAEGRSYVLVKLNLWNPLRARVILSIMNNRHVLLLCAVIVAVSFLFWRKLEHKRPDIAQRVRTANPLVPAPEAAAPAAPAPKPIPIDPDELRSGKPLSSAAAKDEGRCIADPAFASANGIGPAQSVDFCHCLAIYVPSFVHPVAPEPCRSSGFAQLDSCSEGAGAAEAKLRYGQVAEACRRWVKTASGNVAEQAAPGAPAEAPGSAAGSGDAGRHPTFPLMAPTNAPTPIQPTIAVKGKLDVQEGTPVSDPGPNAPPPRMQIGPGPKRTAPAK